MTRFMRRPNGERGQSIVEFALVVPLLLIIFLAVADVARVYTSMMTIESAAREAADYGAWNSSYWLPSNAAGTQGRMMERACLAARSLPDYAGPDDACTNPEVTIALTEPDGTPGTEVACSDPDRSEPCRVAVTLEYDFHLIVPLSIDIFDVHVGFPSQLTFERTSIFAISDFDID